MATALVLVLGGCTGSSDEVDGPATGAAAVRTSGALAVGFEIEPGSVLIGAVFPMALPYGGGFQAFLRLDGDLQRVVEGYIRQAEDLGFSFEAGPGVSSEGLVCSDPDDENTGDDPPDPYLLSCGAYGPGPDDQRLHVGGAVERDGEGYVQLSATVWSSAPAPSLSASDGAVAPATDVELAPAWRPQGDERHVHLVEGSAPIFGPVVQSGSGYLVMLRVSGDLLPVMRGYEEQFDRAGFDGQGLVGDDDEPILVTSTAGGGTLTAVGVAGDPSYVLIERINDP